ncbi:MAG: FimB/Mfa2 family fimbrial subunit [Marinifilaceae bacterium]
MKKIIFLALLGTTLLSCSKNEEQPKDDTLYEVNFNVSAFNQEVIPLKSTQTLNGVVNYLDYIVYSEDGGLLYRKEYKNTDENFGVVKDQFPKGKYHIIFFGLQDNLFGENFTEGTNLFQEASYYSDEPLEDSFFRKITLTVPDENSNLAISLERVVGKLEVIFTDNMPQEVVKIEPLLTGAYWGLEFATEGLFHQATIDYKTYTITDAEKGKPNFKMEFYSYASTGGINCGLTIKCLDVNNEVVATKSIPNIKIYRNKITRLSGSMFDGNNAPAEGNFKIEVDPDWAEVVEQGF